MSLNPATSAKTNIARVLLVLLVVLVFARLVNDDFLGWDDYQTIATNAKYNPEINWLKVLRAWLPQHAEMDIYIPVTQTVWAVLATFARVQTPDLTGSTLNPAIFHAGSIAVHAINVVLVFEILRRLFANQFFCFLGALLFAVHPVQVETVAWTSGMKDLLSGMFVFLTILNYLRYRQSSHRGYLMVAIFCFILGMLSKPNAMMTPGLLLVIELLLLKGTWRVALRKTWIFFLLAIPCLVAAKVIQPSPGVPSVPWYDRPLLAADSLAFYLCKIVWPIHLTADYGRLPTLVLQKGWLCWTWIIPVVLAVFIFRARGRFPLLPLAGAIFVIAVSPVLGLTRFEFQYYSTVADHYLYIAMLGAAITVCVLVSHLRYALSLVPVLLIACGIRTITQEAYWLNNVTFFSHAVALNPDSFMGYNNLGASYQILRDYPRAEESLLHAIQLKPTYSKSHDTLGTIYVAEGRIAEAINQIEQMIEYGKDLPPNLAGNVFASEVALSKYLLRAGDYAKAKKYLHMAYRLHPEDAEVNQLLARAATRPTSHP